MEEIKIAIDCANGAASSVVKLLVQELNLDAKVLFDNPSGININEDCGSTNMKKLANYVVENKMDIGIAFDGDADRCLFIDEKRRTNRW